jgi:hypothetical protein
MVEWRVTPEYINDNWTEELLLLMFEKRAVRLQKKAGTYQQQNYNMVPDIELFKMVGYTPEVVNAN